MWSGGTYPNPVGRTPARRVMDAWRQRESESPRLRHAGQAGHQWEEYAAAAASQRCLGGWGTRRFLLYPRKWRLLTQDPQSALLTP